VDVTGGHLKVGLAVRCKTVMASAMVSRWTYRQSRFYELQYKLENITF